MAERPRPVPGRKGKSDLIDNLADNWRTKTVFIFIKTVLIGSVLMQFSFYNKIHMANAKKYIKLFLHYADTTKKYIISHKNRRKQEMREVTGTLKIVPKKRKELLSWFASQSQKIQLKICKTKSLTLATWRSKYKEQIVTTTVEQAELASLLDAILKIRRNLQGGKTEKAFEVRLLEAKEKTKERKAPASTAISKNYLELIHRLRAEGLSWRRVQSYIKTYHRKLFAFSTLRSTYVSEYGADAI